MTSASPEPPPQAPPPGPPDPATRVPLSEWSRYDLLCAAMFKVRGLLMVPLLVFLFLFRRWEWEFEPGIWATGLTLFVLGVALRTWCQTHMRYRLNIEHPLAVGGPYACIRNPVYIGNTLVIVALAVLCELPWMVPVALVYAGLVYGFAVRFEEMRLLRRYGADYADYCARVPRWIPRLGARRAPAPAEPVSWRRAALVEWQCFLLLAIPIVKEALG